MYLQELDYGTKRMNKRICDPSGQVITKNLVTRRGSPVACRPSTTVARPIDKIHQLRKMALTNEPVMQFGCPSKFNIESLFYDTKHHLQP